MFCCFLKKWAKFGGRKVAIVQGIRFRMNKGRLCARVGRRYGNLEEWCRDD